MVDHSCFGLHSMVVGSSRIVGMIIFSIVEDLSFVGDLIREFVKMLLVVIGLCLPRRQRKIVLVLV